MGLAMTDRELLELAAKAVGIEIRFGLYRYWDGQLEYIEDTTPHLKDLESTSWNPLTDDGDALRLAVILLFEIDMGRGCIAIRHATGIKILEPFNNDPFKATRRAIVRAAAEIGKTKHE
jgi:hypothetical protein